MNHPFELIPLSIETRGEVISSNIDEFRTMVRESLATINRDLRTDEEFGQAELDAKALKSAEDAVKGAKEKALDDAESLHKLFSTLDATAEEIRVARLELEKQINRRKDEVKAELVVEALALFDLPEHVAKRHFEIGLVAAMKGKRTVESMRTALRVYATTQMAGITKSRAMIASFEKAHGQDMSMDRTELEMKTVEAVEAELRRRLEAKRAADEKKRLEAEAATAKAEAAKAQAEATAARAEAQAAPSPAKVDPRNPHNLPPPPRIGSIPVGAAARAEAGDLVLTPEETEAEEFQVFRAVLLESFAPAKAARVNLKHAANIARAQAFADDMAAAWKKLNTVEVAP